VTASDNQTPAAQVSRWLDEGHATWGAPLRDGTWAEYQIHQAGAHNMADLLERHLPERAA
jgi:hypothetical protein